ncbi:MAG: hypothetical protein QF411_11160, partial [Planctomycetota bacterium]|nr:hypothetical protein [Planctomycetota bacterium]
DCNGNAILDICDIAAGTSLDDNGNGTPDECECFATEYCTASANSSGLPAQIHATGSLDIGTGTFGLLADDCPPGAMGLFYYGTSSVYMPFYNGFRCVGGNIFRLFPASPIGGNGVATHQADFNTTPMGSGAGAVYPGSTWYFQFWFRDHPAGGWEVNLSNGLEVTFCP